MVTKILVGADYTVVTARDGREAVDTFCQRRDDLDAVIFDITMPRMTGLEALQKLEDLGAEIPLLLMTGHDANADWDFQRAAAVVRKPFTRYDVLSPLQRALQSRRQPIMKRGAADDS